jgi:hypothetical protein
MPTKKPTSSEVLQAGEYKPTLTADLSDKQVVEEQTTNALATQNSTDEYLATLKDLYSGITIKDIHDDEGYRAAKEAKKVLQTTRTTTEKICKVGREEALKIQKEWIAKEKSITGVIAELEDPITIRIKEIDTEIENIHKEEEAQKKLPFRIETIKKVLGEDFVINEEIVKALSDLEFSTYMVTERENAIAKKEQDIKDKEEKAAQELRDEQIRKDALVEQGKAHRRQLLTALGLVCNNGIYTITIGTEIIVGPTEESLQSFSQEAIDVQVTNLSKLISDARDKYNTEQTALAAQKIFDDAEAARQEKNKADELALAKQQAATPDKQKLIQYVDALSAAIPYPIVGSPEAQAVVDRAIFCVDAMQKDLMARINLMK